MSMAELSRTAWVWLDDEGAADTELVGTKAAALAAASRAGLPVLPGFVLTTAAVSAVDTGQDLDGACAALRPAWRELSGAGSGSLVVRSSSPQEDTAQTSMAGRFASVVDVRGWDEFVAAVRAVLASRAAAAQGSRLEAESPIAVLVQPLVRAVKGGVLFGVDPVSGRADRRVVAAVHGMPEQVVSGRADPTRLELTPSGRVIAASAGADGTRLSRSGRRRLASLVEQARRLFGRPQDIEWAFDREGELWLLQSRPVTSVVRGIPRGPVFGPGPVAETFPERLSPLEEDLWVPALREAIRQALRIIGTRPRAEVEASPLVVSVDGWVAVDLDLVGERRPPRSWLSRLDPRGPLLRAGSAWRVGRLRASLAGLAEDLVGQCDGELGAVPELAALSDRQVVALLYRCRHALVSLHAHEILIGLVVAPGAAPVTGTGMALSVLARARADGLDDAEAIARYPVLLALTAPRVRPVPGLPPVGDSLDPDLASAPLSATVPGTGPGGHDAALLRETLRLRVRWTQELTARAAWELGTRLAGRRLLAAPDEVRDLGLDELDALVAGRAVRSTGRPERAPGRAACPGPLPARFRLTAGGSPVPVPDNRAGGAGAGGGRGSGPAHLWQPGDPPPPARTVLVVRTFEPGLAPHLPGLAGLVAETGSALAHLAILAREAGVPTVVGYPEATRRLRPGEQVTVDGDSGEVTTGPS